MDSEKESLQTKGVSRRESAKYAECVTSTISTSACSLSGRMSHFLMARPPTCHVLSRCSLATPAIIKILFLGSIFAGVS